MQPMIPPRSSLTGVTAGTDAVAAAAALEAHDDDDDSVLDFSPLPSGSWVVVQKWCQDIPVIISNNSLFSIYRVGQVVCHMSWVDFDLDVPQFCPSASSIPTCQCRTRKTVE